jgi:lipopolysaccharide transport system ATP-binding protein
MTPQPILELVDAGKSYRSYASIWPRAAGWITGRPRGFRDHWVLRDVTFAMARGEAIGVVGRNGAGKSTLLKLVAGTSIPTTGSVVVRGRVSAILELGMGFNPELSGRDNAEHACGLLGHDAAFIRDVLPKIEEFADIGEYFNQPVRTYSSGMTMRVAFAVATAARPDLLIVDEALSVGDAAFQRKSMRRIEEFLSEGTSLLFVSHGAESVRALCSRALWLDRGALVQDGPAKDVTEAYERSLFSTVVPRKEPTAGAASYFDEALATTSMEQQYGNGGARIVSVRFVDQSGRTVNTVRGGESFTLEFEVEFGVACRDVHFGMMLKTVEGISVYGTNSDRLDLANDFEAGQRVKVTFALRNHLCPGLYFLNCAASAPGTAGRDYLHRRVDVAILNVLGRRTEEVVAGLADLDARLSVQVLELVHS